MTNQITIQIKMLLNLDWEAELAELNTQEAMGKLESILKEAVEDYVPHRTMIQTTLRKVRKKYTSRIRYMNSKDGHGYQAYVNYRNIAQHGTRRMNGD